MLVLFVFSEQMLVDCMYTSSDNGGCDGGWFDDAWDYMKAVGGAMYPYPYQSGVTSAVRMNVFVHIYRLLKKKFISFIYSLALASSANLR